MKKRNPLPEGDDGRTIAPMNLEGMPGYRPWLKDRQEMSGAGDTKSKTDEPYAGAELTKEQLRAYRFAALKAGLLVAFIFGLVFFLFIAFCDFIWFR